MISKYKYIIFIIFITVITFVSTVAQSVSAATPNPQPSKVATPSATTIIDKLKQIEALKEKIATKVAQLREDEKGAVFGTVKTVDNTTITLTYKSTDKTISYSEDTIFFQMKDGIRSDPIDWKQSKKLKNGDTIAALGYYDTNRANFSAKYIYMLTPQRHLVGKIADKDAENYTITVKEPQGETVVDIETYTKIYSYTKKGGFIKSGFSRLAENGITHIFASENPKEENRVTALKVLFVSSITESISPTVAPTKNSTVSATPTKK